MASYRPMLIANRPFNLEDHHYLEQVYADDTQEVVYLKAAQVGISEYLLSWLLYMAAEWDATGFYVMPTDGHVSDFSAARLGPAIDPLVSPKLAALITAGGSGKRGADKVTLKRVGNRFVYFRGGQIQESTSHGPRAAQLRSVDADTLILDELDELDPRVPPFARARLEHSSIAKVRIASTPTYGDVGIYAEYQKTTQHEYYLTCEACNEAQTLTLANLVIAWDALERPLKWYGQEDGQPYVACRKCGARLDRTRPGFWKALFPDRPVHGYHIVGLASPRKSLVDILDGLNSSDETKRQQTYNQGLGLAYKPRESESLTESILLGCQREYALGIPGPEVPTYAGIDVGRVLNIVIRGKHADGNRPLYAAFQVESFDDAVRLLTEYHVGSTVIDALPETRKARELQKHFGRLKVWLAYFARTTEGAKTNSPAIWNPRELEVDVDRTRAIDTAMALFHQAGTRNPDGSYLSGNVLPVGAKAIRDYFAQMQAPARIMRLNAKGERVPAYISATPDHYALAETYCAVAFLCPYSGWARGAG